MTEARKWLSWIVGRDTENLTREEMIKATLETMAENLSDGIIAPLFYLLIGGAPLALAFKAASTLDSMVGYKNDRYRYFGWASAQLDDLWDDPSGPDYRFADGAGFPGFGFFLEAGLDHLAAGWSAVPQPQRRIAPSRFSRRCLAGPTGRPGRLWGGKKRKAFSGR